MSKNTMVGYLITVQLHAPLCTTKPKWVTPSIFRAFKLILKALNQFNSIKLYFFASYTKGTFLWFKKILFTFENSLFHFWLCRRKLRRAAAVKSVWGNFGLRKVIPTASAKGWLSWGPQLLLCGAYKNEWPTFQRYEKGQSEVSCNSLIWCDSYLNLQFRASLCIVIVLLLLSFFPKKDSFASWLYSVHTFKYFKLPLRHSVWKSPKNVAF